MAILPDIPGIAVTVEVEGQKAKEYQYQHLNESFATPSEGICYIESTPKSEFKVKARFKSSTYGYDINHNSKRPDMEVSFFIDGKKVGTEVLKKPSVTNKVALVGGSMEQQNGHYYEKSWEFGELHLDGDTPDSLLHDAPDGTGSIVVVMRRCLATKEHDQEENRSAKDNAAYHTSRIETSELQAHIQHDSTEQDKRVPRVEWWHTKLSTIDKRAPFARFTFLYRSQYDLQSMGIIARTPTPVPLTEQDPEVLGEKDLRQLVRELRSELERRDIANKRPREKDTLFVTDQEGTDDDETVAEKGDKRPRLEGIDGPIDILEPYSA